ncbi:retention module-containing protein, partial [Vogesella mureinivorans]|uniref:retention module-containing protein n=1 Tax=Vogesella mureinivorans TaxID=657276 RepID=UPI00147951DB
MSLTGKVIAIAADGSQRVLKLGDIVATGERLVVPADGEIELQSSNGHIVKIAEARDLTITDDVFGLQAADATDAAIAPLNADAQQVLAALESGQDPLQGLEDTAAGLAAGGGEDGGNSFVVIGRVAESIQPLTLDNQIDVASTQTTQTADTTTVLVDDSTTVTINNVGPSRDNTPLLTGTGEAGATVVISNAAGQVIATTVVASNGTWSVESTVALPDGSTGLTAVATDTSGNTASSAATAVIDTTTTVTIENVGPTRDTTPLLSGTGEAGATIVVSDKDGNVIGTATVGTDGRWSVESSRPLPEGGSNLTVTATDPLGNTASNTGTAQIDTTAPLAPVVVITEDSNNDGVIANGELVGKVDVSITLPAGTNAGDVLTINSGTTTQTITLTASDISTGTVAITLDPPVEGSQLTVTATLTDPAGNVSPEGKDSAQINTAVIDYVGASTTPGESSTTEGNDLTFEVRLSTSSTIATTFDFALQDGTATADDYGTATFSNGVSYDAATGKITVPAGVTSFTVTVPTSNDTTDEADETVKLSIGGKDATGTILDNDGTPTIEHIGKPDPSAANPNDVSATEGSDLAFTVKLSNASSTATSFDFALKDGTATADDYGSATFSNGVSYDAATGKITVPAGVTSFTVTVPTSNDTTDEADETVKLSIGGKDATGTIIDNDGTPTIESIGNSVGTGDVSATEGSDLAFTVKLSNASSSATTFDFALQDGTATADDYGTATFSNGVSYDAATGKITVPAGVTSFTVTVPTSNDTT